MATTEDRLSGIDELEDLYRSPVVEPPATRPGPEQGDVSAQRDVSAKDARRLLFSWAAVIGAILLFEPAPDNAAVAVPAWAEFAAFGFLSALMATAFGLGSRRRWALGASLVAVGFGAVLAIACAATDHHTGSWWAYELAVFGALGAMTMGAARRAK